MQALLFLSASTPSTDLAYASLIIDMLPIGTGSFTTGSEQIQNGRDLATLCNISSIFYASSIFICFQVPPDWPLLDDFDAVDFRRRSTEDGWISCRGWVGVGKISSKKQMKIDEA
jgi:hypothetical protein